jgi:hypothetical protein
LFIYFYRRIPSITFNPLHENEKSILNSNSKINNNNNSMISINRENSPKIFNIHDSIYKNDKNSRKNDDNNNFLDKILILKQQHYDIERKRDEIELKKKSKQIKFKIEKDLNSFLNNMYDNSYKFYNMTLNAKLSNKKYDLLSFVSKK